MAVQKNKRLLSGGGHRNRPFGATHSSYKCGSKAVQRKRDAAARDSKESRILKEIRKNQWPWETGEMATEPEPAVAAAPPTPLYTLPTVRDRNAESGRRPATARELARMRRDQGAFDYFRW